MHCPTASGGVDQLRGESKIDQLKSSLLGASCNVTYLDASAEAQQDVTGMDVSVDYAALLKGAARVR